LFTKDAGGEGGGPEYTRGRRERGKEGNGVLDQRGGGENKTL